MQLKNQAFFSLRRRDYRPSPKFQQCDTKASSQGNFGLFRVYRQLGLLVDLQGTRKCGTGRSDIWHCLAFGSRQMQLV